MNEVWYDISMDLTKLIKLYREMSDHTRQYCIKVCEKSGWTHTCCEPENCDHVIERAHELGIDPPERTSHEKLPLMGPNGCVAPPHLRPLCTVHNCRIASLGYIPGDTLWTETYFDLRDQLSESEWEMSKSQEGDVPS